MDTPHFWRQKNLQNKPRAVDPGGGPACLLAVCFGTPKALWYLCLRGGAWQVWNKIPDGVVTVGWMYLDLQVVPSKPYTLGPQNHEKWRFWTPNIWVITPKNEGYGFPWYRMVKWQPFFWGKHLVSWLEGPDMRKFFSNIIEESCLQICCNPIFWPSSSFLAV